MVERSQDSSPPLASIVIPAYNHEEYIEEAIRSVLAQSYPRLELIVIDDGSTDGTDAVIRRVLAETDGAFVYVPKKHEGLVPTVNLGLRMARGKYFSQFGSDDILFPDTVARQVERMEFDPELGLVCGDAYYLEGVVKTRRRRLGTKARRYFEARDPYRELLFRNFVINLTAMYRRELFLQLGGFDETIPTLEDWDSALRVAEHHRIGYIDAPLGYWRIHSTNTHKRIHWMFTGIRETLEKHSRQGRLAGRRLLWHRLFHEYYYLYGRQLHRAGDYRAALRAFGTAWKHRPLSPRSPFRMLRSTVRRTIVSDRGGPPPTSIDRTW